MAEVSFRLAQPSDCNEIVRLSEDVFPQGRDYLVHTFQQWQNMPNRAFMLAFSGEKLVGLQACLIVDDGETFIRQAMRITPELQGKGLSRKISEAMDVYVRLHFPKVCRLRFTSYLRHNFSSPTRYALELINIGYQVEDEDARRKKPSVDCLVTLEQCTKHYLSDIVWSEPTKTKLFPNNVVIIDWCPFEVVRSNIDYILQCNDCVFVEKRIDGSHPNSCSFGRFSPKAKVVEWLVSVYTNEPSLFEAHVIYQFKRACELIKGEFTFVCFHEKSLNGYGKKVMEETLQLKHDEFYTNELLYLYERDF